MKLNTNKTFWQKLHRPFFVLAPMDDVTDIAFRQMFAKFGKDNHLNPVIFTEFVSSDGLALADEKGKAKLMKKLDFCENERPVVAQIFGANIENMRNAAKLVEDLGFDGVDINMGCPDKSVEKTGSGAALIKNPELALEIVSSLKGVVNIPVSVKTRLGYNKIDFKWIKSILSSEPAALTLHLRTRAEMSKTKAHWELLSDILELRNSISENTILIANGDIKSINEAKEKSHQFNLDAIMIGRGLFGNPLFFKGEEVDMRTKIRLLIKHLELFERYLSDIKSYAVMKKHFRAYISSFKGAQELRTKLMATGNCQEAIKVLSGEINTL